MKKIIKGYKGIMDLDLTDVDSIYHRQLIEDHYNDIKLYKIEQSKLKPKLRYENTIERINKMHEYENEQTRIRKQQELEEQNKRDKLMLEIYYKYNNDNDNKND